jgi:hypothetical protein
MQLCAWERDPFYLQNILKRSQGRCHHLASRRAMSIVKD